jgi:hypothetical protein
MVLLCLNMFHCIVFLNLFPVNVQESNNYWFTPRTVDVYNVTYLFICDVERPVMSCRKAVVCLPLCL